MSEEILVSGMQGSEACDQWIKHLLDVVIVDAFDRKTFSEDRANELVEHTACLFEPLDSWVVADLSIGREQV